MESTWRTHSLAVPEDGTVDQLLRREWLLTNGTGAYSMGTAAGVNTRRYHGMLVASARPPVGRIVTLNQLFEQLVVQPKRSRARSAAGTSNSGQAAAQRGGRAQQPATAATAIIDDGDETGPTVIDFASALFRASSGADLFEPVGHRALVRFDKGLTVAWTYAASGVQLTRQLNLHYKQQAATITYTLSGLDALDASRLVFAVRPVVTLRDFHSLLREGTASDLVAEHKPGTEGRSSLTVQRGSAVATIGCPDARFTHEPQWWYGFHYPIETERGQDDTEDAWIPGRLEYTIDPDAEQASFQITVALGDSAAEPDQGLDDNTGRATHLEPIVKHLVSAAHLDKRVSAGAKTKKPKKAVSPAVTCDQRTIHALGIAADDFVVDRVLAGKNLSTILAGYPWFADWGRDTFIALPGLLLATGRHDEARDVLRVFAGAIRRGLIPNRFDDYDDRAAHYNTVDASLWFVNAAMQYHLATGDQDTWKDWLADAALSTIDAYLKGTDFDIRMAGDGLITAGSPHTQLTWMDAACGGTVFTPRHGKAVEINALWYNALKGMAELIGSSHPAEAKHYLALGKRVTRAFLRVFWDADLGHLNDHVWTDDKGEEHVDRTCRPNQIFVCSLPHSPLPQTKQRTIVAAVKQQLLTPYGLRTLPQDNPSYRGVYEGSVYDRDGAYHQGTVWPWLIGPYAEAVLRLGKFKPAAKTEALAAITPLLQRLLGDGLGQVNEIHDGDPPHRPVGCIAQAWSVAELLRILTLLHNPPA